MEGYTELGLTWWQEGFLLICGPVVFLIFVGTLPLLCLIGPCVLGCYIFVTGQKVSVLIFDTAKTKLSSGAIEQIKKNLHKYSITGSVVEESDMKSNSLPLLVICSVETRLEHDVKAALHRIPSDISLSTVTLIVVHSPSSTVTRSTKTRLSPDIIDGVGVVVDWYMGASKENKNTASAEELRKFVKRIDARK